MRIMGLDYGSKTIGVAMSDELLLTAQPLETITRNKEHMLRKSLARIKQIVEENNVELIVLGLPLGMGGGVGIRAKKTYEFLDRLKERVNIPIVLQDERLTTIEANEILKESGVAADNRKKYIDQVAASIILKEYMEGMNGGK